VVLVDDHPGVLVAFGRMLQPYCDVIASVSSGTDAVEVALRLRPDVMVVDLMMPEVDGLEVCRRVKRTLPGIDIIIVTAFDDACVRSVAIRQGASAFVSKSWASATLGQTIQRLATDKLATRIEHPLAG
jgi:NarL family two-component system response regulator LiaR